MAHGIDLVLPLDYLQEIAAHLIWAARDYGDIIDIDPDLAGSENAFVAHYSTLKQRGEIENFPAYIEGFGLTRQQQATLIAQPDSFYSIRDRAMISLQRLFEQHDFVVTPLGRHGEKSRKKAEVCVAYAMRELDISRPPVVVDHDTRTAAFLFEQEKSPERSLVLCTWDQLHFKIRSMEEVFWDVLDPAAFTDVLSVCRIGEELAPSTTPRAFIKTMNEAALRDAARIWDTIISIEKEGMHNATLIMKARAFKKDYMERSQKNYSSSQIVSEWQAWKSQMSE
jgi:hypothetical protein